jgi:hypothetical protein
MKKSSPKLRSFVLSDEISKNRKLQIAANILLILVLGINIYNLVISIGLFDTIKF